MPRRQVKHRPLKKISIGDMRELVTLKRPVIVAPTFGEASFSRELYNIEYPVWASIIVSGRGEHTFDDVQLEEQATHSFRIRYIEDVTSEFIVVYEDKNYKILNIFNPENRNEYLFLNARLLGDSDVKANQ